VRVYEFRTTRGPHCSFQQSASHESITLDFRLQGETNRETYTTYRLPQAVLFPQYTGSFQPLPTPMAVGGGGKLFGAAPDNASRSRSEGRVLRKKRTRLITGLLADVLTSTVPR